MPRLAAVLFLLLTTTLHANPITEENALPGTDRWLLHQPSREIAGYASSTSVTAGEAIGFHVSTNDPAFTIEVFRTGWYGGLGARRMTEPVSVTAVEQPSCPTDPLTGLIRCRWSESYSLTVPAGWLSGVYLAKLTGAPSGNQSYAMFVVRDRRRAALALQSGVTTYQAYNNWGGKSLYAFNSTGGPATKVSFDRPYASAFGTGGYLFQWEYNMVRFLEREGYDVTYITEVDTHEREVRLKPDATFPQPNATFPQPDATNPRVFLSVGHDEYWSAEMRNHVEAARDRGTSLMFLGADAAYWQIRFEDNDRTIVGYKEVAGEQDPLAIDGDPRNDRYVTGRFRDRPVSRPEERLVGVMYAADPVDADIVITNPNHWAFAGTSLRAGDALKGLLGYEVDAIYGDASPPNLERLAHSPFTDQGRTRYSDMTMYEAPSGALVFAIGSMQWNWGLDDYNAPAWHPSRVDTRAQQITRNVLNRMLTVTPRPVSSSGRDALPSAIVIVAAVGALAYVVFARIYDRRSRPVRRS